MKKFIYDIANIRNINIRYNLIITEDGDPPRNKFEKTYPTVSKFKYNGSEYTKISPRGYIVFAIDGKNSYDSNAYINLTYMTFYSVRRALRNVINKIYTTNDIFMFHKQTLVLNKDKAREISENIQVNDRSIMIYPIVISDNDNAEIQYEGIGFSINNYSIMSTLSIDEAVVLYECLKDINMVELAALASKWFDDVSVKDDISKPLYAPARESQGVHSNFSSNQKSYLPDL